MRSTSGGMGKKMASMKETTAKFSGVTICTRALAASSNASTMLHPCLRNGVGQILAGSAPPHVPDTPLSHLYAYAGDDTTGTYRTGPTLARRVYKNKRPSRREGRWCA